MRHPPSHQRHTSRRVGLLVAVATAVFMAGLLQAGVLKQLFEDRLELRVELPEGGLSGLRVGATVEVLGTEAGQVTDIVLQPDAPFYAEVALDPEMRPFVRRDSAAVIRKQFGLVGSAFLEIERGTGAPLDWDFAVIQARADPAPFETVNDVIADLRDRVFPVLADTQTTVAALAKLSQALEAPDGNLRAALGDLRTLTEGVAAGQGSVGRLLRDDALAIGLERVIASLGRNLDQLSGVIDNLEAGSGDVARTAAALSEGEDSLAAVLARANASLGALQDLLARAAASMPAVNKTVTNAAGASETLPSLLIRTESTLAELSRVLRQLQRSWLLGGGGADARQGPAPLSPVAEPTQ